MGLSEGYGVSAKADAMAMLNTALDAGVNFFDTADFYGRGDNEKLLGEAFHDCRDKVVIASKCGLRRDPELDDVYHIDNSPAMITQAIDDSLRRLNTETIDLFYLHRVDYSQPIELAMQALSDAVAAGKCRYLGLSEADADTIARAHAVHPLTAIQSEYSLWTKTVENNEVLATCRRLGIGFVAYSPLGRGFLTGKIKSFAELSTGDCRRYLPRFQQSVFDDNARLLDEVQHIANLKGCTLAQVALAWVLAQGDDIVPIPGTKQPRYLQENIETAEVVELTDKDIQHLNSAAKRYAPQGARYAVEVMESNRLDD